MSGSVLIADGSAARARALRDALGERGFATTRAEHGAAALECALAEVPDAVVAVGELELISGERLAEILRANPRTRHVAVMAVAAIAPDAPEREHFDTVLAPGTEPGEVALRVEVLCADRARQAAAWREAQQDHDVEGSLEQVALSDLLQLFHAQRRSGTLELRRDPPGEAREERGRVWLREGSALGAATGPVEGEKALHRLLAWRSGRFAFTPGPVDVEQPIATPTRALLAEAARQQAEWDRLREALPALDASVTPAPDAELPEVVHPLTREVLALVAAHASVREVLDHSAHPDYQVLRTLQALLERKLVVLRHPGAAPARRASDGLFSPVQARRLRDWLARGRPRGEPSGDPRLVVIASDAAGTRDFARLVDSLPGAEIEEPFKSGRAAAGDLLPIGRLRVDDGLALELLHLPVAETFAPLRAVAAHRALGVLLLLSQPIGFSEETLRPVVESLRTLPGSRLFHVVLLRKGDKLTPAELHAQMSVLDAGSLFLLPLEGSSDPAALLRTMLGRVIP